MSVNLRNTDPLGFVLLNTQLGKCLRADRVLDCHGDNIAKFGAKTRETHDGCGDVFRKTRLGQDALVDQFDKLGQNHVLLTARNKFWQLKTLLESTVAKNREGDRAERASGRAKS